MSQKYFLVECISKLNDIIKQPLQQTQRIKFTTFEVSSNYIIFGATTGGIYIFKRYPCEFIKLIPGKEGAVTQVAISPEETYVAITTNKGLVVLIENCFNEGNIQYQVYTEHKSYIITAIKWHYSDLYCGDSTGKISVITLTNILSKTIFQPPSAILMQLDSTIVQLDTYSKFLLVSTKVKTFLCDTEEEQYRQIGKKIRDGEFGACFFTENLIPKENHRVKEKTIFKILKEGEKFSNDDVDGVKIFCARPGLRIWEANFDASVVCTYQFKNVVNQMSGEIFQLGDDVNSKFLVQKNTPSKAVVHIGKMFIISNKFLLSFLSNNLLIFDTHGVNLQFKYNLGENIKDVKIVDNYIYIWDKKDVKVLSLIDLETLLLKTLARKQYKVCSEICFRFKDEFEVLVTNSLDITPLINLKGKISDEEIMNAINPLLDRIKQSGENVSTNGIVKVENGYVNEAAGCSYNYDNKSYDLQSNHEGIRKEEVVEPNPNSSLNDPTLDPNYILNILHRQYQVNKMYSNIETPKLYEVLSVKSLDEIVVLFKSFITHVKEIDAVDNNVENWCYIQYLKYITKDKHPIADLNTDSMALKYIFDAFISINSDNNNVLCDCTFPLPTVKNCEAKFYNVGCDLYKKLPKRNLKNSVPCMWRYKITEFTGDVNASLPLLVQFSDLNLIDLYSNKLNYDMWDDVVKYLIRLKKNICLNCEKSAEFDISNTISWKDIGMVMIKSIGGASVVKLLQKYSKFIPNSELGLEFYQTCIFSTVVNNNQKSNAFMDGVFKNPYLNIQFEDSLKTYLDNKNMNNFYTKDLTKSTLKCSSCDLPLNNPILEAKEPLVCGHVFHKMCLNSMNNICCICVVK